MHNAPRIVIVGGGFAGARAAQDLATLGFTHTTLVDKKDYFEVTYATLRGVTDPARWGVPSRIRYADFLKADFIQSEVVEVSPEQVVLANGKSLGFDYAVISSGSAYANFPVAKTTDALSMERRNEEVEAEKKRIEQALRILVVGGGPVGVEYAGELAEAFPDKEIHLVHSGAHLLTGFKRRAGLIAESQLRALGVHVHLGEKLSRISDTHYKSSLPDKEYHADLVCFCGGMKPATEFLRAHFSGALTPQGRIRVDGHLCLEGSEHIFVAGDCADTPEEKMGAYADLQGALVAKNISLMTQNKKRKAYRPHTSPVGLVTVGSNSGVAQLPFVVTKLKLLLGIKQKHLFIRHQFKTLGVPEEED